MLQTGALSEGDFASLFNFLPIGAYRSTPDGRMVRANPALVEINGYAGEAEMLDAVNQVDRHWYVQPGRRAEFFETLQRDGFVRGFVSEIQRHGDGLQKWVSENAHEVRGATGQLLYYEGTVEDITERVQAEQALQRSEAQLRLITSQIPGMVFVLHLDPQGRRTYQYVSPGVRDIYGLAPEALLRDASLLARYRHPDDYALLEADHHRVASGGSAVSNEFRIVLPHGEVKWLLRRSSGVASETPGRLWVGVLLDITSQKQAEAALLESEALWKLALEGSGDGVWDWNFVTGEEYLSAGIKRMFGFAATDDLKLATDRDVRTHPDDVAQMHRDRRAHFEGQSPMYRNEHRVLCKDGRWKWVLSRGLVIARDEEGRPIRMVGTHTDITELKEAAAQRIALEAQLREAQKLEAIGTLAGGVAHDFNNLLAVILGNLALAREDVAPGHPAQESLEEIGRASVRARHLVQQILTYSRRQVQELQHQPLQPLVREALALMRSLLPAGVRLTSALADEALPVLADATQVQQVLMNLCTNAWQAIDGQGGAIRVGLRPVALNTEQAHRLGGIPVGDCACLSVSDNGPGIDAATQLRLFEPFFTTKAHGAGTGLGLAVVHGIVKAHRGAIEVHSEPGAGTRFDVYLPLSAPAAHTEAAQAAVERSMADARRETQRRHVVYIDDYEAMVFLVGRLLRKQGYQVSTFTSGMDALAWLRSEAGPVDIVVTDQNMPGISGIEVAAELQRLRPGLRTVLMSGHVNDELRAQAAAVGVLEVLGKQDSMEALGESISALLDTLVS